MINKKAWKRCVREEQSCRRLCCISGESDGCRGGGGGGQGSSPECHSGRHTEGGEGRRVRPGPEVRRKRGSNSEYGGLVLSADSALGFLGVNEPRGATLRLRIPFLFHNVPL